ncbi:hypothetical protein GON03_13475 [Nocardioides sp. MAH-18]|uniref:Uncharacterized protein n=1 Tax=Nocardioides agri TaxID=2682843 RepID=A0A6L6XS65_9ACTN|nr:MULTISPECIES: hypothetical protein [unclassified Nocardioides]MBA2955343.1 hypothetical protein [Nocardioides sp. CGMCC 1.13656]MVQ50194.1 hypothetical protein [Nocardioides sp. MAH-18]
MFVDTGAVRHLAAELAERAAEIRATATDLHRRVAAVPWQGAAADAMRAHAAWRIAALLRAADLHDDAGEALVEHADAVDAALALLASIVDEVVDTAADTAGQVADTAGAVAQAVADHTVGLLP